MTVDARGRTLEGQCRDPELRWVELNRELATLVDHARNTGRILELGRLREIRVDTASRTLWSRCDDAGRLTTVAASAPSGHARPESRPECPNTCGRKTT